MPEGELRIDDAPRPEDVALLADRLYEHNASVTACDDGRWLSIFVRDAAHDLAAGLHGWTWAGVGCVETLWVRADRRRTGLGRRLLAAAESEAARRGCSEMHLSTHSYQAPEFYRRLGYEIIAEVPGWPRGTTRIHFRKALTA